MTATDSLSDSKAKTGVYSFLPLTQDVPECVAGTLMFQGCNLACPFCFNKEMIPQHNFPVERWTAILDEIQSRPYNGIAFGGGEPLLHQKEITDMIHHDFPREWKKAIYTNFTTSFAPGFFDLVDYWIVSLKPKELYSLTQWNKLALNMSLYGYSPKVTFVEVAGYGLAEQFKYIDPKEL